MTDADAAQLLEDAKRGHAHDLAKVADLQPDQLDYLANLDQVPDPLSDGIDCDDQDRGE